MRAGCAVTSVPARAGCEGYGRVGCGCMGGRSVARQRRAYRPEPDAGRHPARVGDRVIIQEDFDRLMGEYVQRGEESRASDEPRT